jgi:hypothetical protein
MSRNRGALPPDRHLLMGRCEDTQAFLSSGSRGWNLMYNFGFRGWAAWNVEGFPTFRQKMQLPSSGWTNAGALYKAVGGEWSVKDVIGETEKRDAIQSVANTRHLLPGLHKTFPPPPPKLIFTLKMETAMVCRNGKPSWFDADCPRKPKIYKQVFYLYSNKCFIAIDWTYDSAQNKANNSAKY